MTTGRATARLVLKAISGPSPCIGVVWICCMYICGVYSAVDACVCVCVWCTQCMIGFFVCGYGRLRMLMFMLDLIKCDVKSYLIYY